MRKRLTVDQPCILREKDGTQLGTLVSIVVDLDQAEEPRGVRGGEEVPSQKQTESSSDVVKLSTPQGGAGGSQNEPLFVTPQLEVPSTGETFDPASTTVPGAIRIVWAHYQEVISGGTRYRLDAKRETIIRNALKVRPMETVLAAIDGLAASLHHNGQNDRRKKYLGIQYALAGKGAESNDERIDKMAEKAGQASAARSNSRPGMIVAREFADTLPSASRETFWLHVQSVVRMQANPDHQILSGIGQQSASWLADLHRLRVLSDDNGRLLGLQRIPRDPTHLSP